MSVWLLAWLIVPLTWMCLNRLYGGVWGQPLRWPYFWAAHGALLFRRRLPEWERS